jgi:hypothetical protein
VVRRRVPLVAPAVLVGVAAPIAAAAAAATTTAAAAAAAAVRVRRALPAALVVPRQAQAAAAPGLVELRQLVEPAQGAEMVSARSCNGCQLATDERNLPTGI